MCCTKCTTNNTPMNPAWYRNVAKGSENKTLTAAIVIAYSCVLKFEMAYKNGFALNTKT